MDEAIRKGREGQGHTALVEVLRKLWLKFCRSTTSSYYLKDTFVYGY